MKIFKLMAVALVAMCGFVSCNECDHEFIEIDHSADLVGTWTCLTADYAEALVIKADGSVVSTGVEDGEYWDGVKGNIKTVNNKMTLTFEDGDYPLLVRHTWPLLLRAWALERKLRVALSHVESILYIVICIC